MRISLIFLLAAAALAFSDKTPMMSSVDPATGRAGDELTVEGTDLGANVVAAVYLTDGQNDTKLVVTAQTDSAIKFKIPAQAKAGRYALMVLTKGEGARLIEEPVKVTIEASGKAID